METSCNEIGIIHVEARQWEDTLQRLKSSRQKNKNYRRAIKDLQKSYEIMRHSRDTALKRVNTYLQRVDSVERANEILVKRVKELEREKLGKVREDINRPWWRIW